MKKTTQLPNIQKLDHSPHLSAENANFLNYLSNHSCSLIVTLYFSPFSHGKITTGIGWRPLESVLWATGGGGGGL